MRRLQALAQSGDYASIREWVSPGDAGRTIEVLRAVDEIVRADAAMGRAFAEQYILVPPGWDLSILRNNLGPFSREVTVIREDLRGDSAVVTVQESDHLPLLHLHFERQGDRWRYRPEPAPAGLPAEMRRLARFLRETADWARSGADARALSDALEFRVVPQIARIERAANPPSLTAIDGRDVSP